MIESQQAPAMLSKPTSWEVVGEGPELLVHYSNGNVGRFYLTEHGLLAIQALIKCYIPINGMMTIQQHLDELCYH